MPHRSQKFIDNAGGRSLLQMALDLHGYFTGAADLRNPHGTAEALREAVREWKQGHPNSLLFDSCVYTLIRTSLGEYDDHVLRKIMSGARKTEEVK